MKKYYINDVAPTVEDIWKINFSHGLNLPHEWFRQIQTDGKPDIMAVLVIGIIVDAYQPSRTDRLEQKFDGDTLLFNRTACARKLGTSVKQIDRVLAKLVEEGIIKYEVRPDNELYIEPKVDAIRDLTFGGDAVRQKMKVGTNKPEVTKGKEFDVKNAVTEITRGVKPKGCQNEARNNSDEVDDALLEEALEFIKASENSFWRLKNFPKGVYRKWLADKDSNFYIQFMDYKKKLEVAKNVPKRSNFLVTFGIEDFVRAGKMMTSIGFLCIENEEKIIETACAIARKHGGKEGEEIEIKSNYWESGILKIFLD